MRHATLPVGETGVASGKEKIRVVE